MTKLVNTSATILINMYLENIDNQINKDIHNHVAMSIDKNEDNHTHKDFYQ